MSYTTPRTWVAGEVATAANLNTHVRDNIAWLATDSPACRIYNNAALTLTTGSFQVLTANSERFDNASIHSTSSNTERMTVPTGGGGKFVVGGNIAWAADGAGVERHFAMNLNGVAGTTIARTSAASWAVIFMQSLCTVYSANAADYFNASAYHDAGHNMNVLLGAAYTPEFYMHWFRT